MRRTLTDRTVQALKPAAPGKRSFVADALVPGFGVRVTDKGQRTYVLYTRFPGHGHPARRSLGEVGELTLSDAREKARRWLALIARGIDPAEDARRQRSAEAERRQNTFSAAAEEYIAQRLSTQRNGARAAREIRTELVPHWGDRPLADITRRDVVGLIGGVAERGPYYARNIYQHARGLFSWAARQGLYGLENSPCGLLRPRDVINKPLPPRQRVLSEPELRALWRCAERLGYPYGPLVRMLLLTGGRLSEVAGARWREVQVERKVWMIPPERFKSDATHLVPLTDTVLELLDALPRWSEDCLFSTTGGVNAVNGFSKAKARVDRLMFEEMGAAPPSWVFHDIRRTVRTQLSRLRISSEVAELVIGHGKKGLARVYDQHQYLDEMREALEAWNTRLRTVIEPPPANVVPIKAAGGLT